MIPKCKWSHVALSNYNLVEYAFTAQAQRCQFESDRGHVITLIQIWLIGAAIDFGCSAIDLVMDSKTNKLYERSSLGDLPPLGAVAALLLVSLLAWPYTLPAFLRDMVAWVVRKR